MKKTAEEWRSSPSALTLKHDGSTRTPRKIVPIRAPRGHNAGSRLKDGLGARRPDVPNFLKYNRPESPNVVRAWPHAFDLLPECELKVQLFERLQGFVKGLSKGFREAFRESFCDPSRRV